MMAVISRQEVGDVVGMLAKLRFQHGGNTFDVFDPRLDSRLTLATHSTVPVRTSTHWPMQDQRQLGDNGAGFDDEPD